MKYICLLLLGINVCVCAMDFGDDDDFVKKLVKGSVFEKPLGQQPAIEKKSGIAAVNAQGTTGSDLQRGAQYVAIAKEYKKPKKDVQPVERRFGRGCDLNAKL